MRKDYRNDSRVVIIPPGHGRDEQALKKAWKILEERTLKDSEEEYFKYRRQRTKVRKLSQNPALPMFFRKKR